MLSPQIEGKPGRANINAPSSVPESDLGTDNDSEPVSVPGRVGPDGGGDGNSVEVREIGSCKHFFTHRI